MKVIAFILALTLSLSGCNAQDEQKDPTARDRSSAEIQKNPGFEPKGSWTVNKELDENGNLIRYDSTYTYSYSSRNGDTMKIRNVDSVIRSFQNYFEDRFPKEWDQSFMNPYWTDPNLLDDFFKDDYFHSRWKDDFFDMEKKFLQMDSLRNKFSQDLHPEFYDSQNENDKIPDQKT